VGTVHHDLHTTIAAERDVAELLSLAAWLHTQATVPWLSITNAPIDLRWQALTLARHAVGDRDTTARWGSSLLHQYGSPTHGSELAGMVVENTKPPTANAVTRTPTSGPSGPG
jgi:hypothetical protein